MKIEIRRMTINKKRGMNRDSRQGNAIRPIRIPAMKERSAGISGRLNISGLFSPDPGAQCLEFLLQGLISPIEMIYSIYLCPAAFRH